MEKKELENLDNNAVSAEEASPNRDILKAAGPATKASKAKSSLSISDSLQKIRDEENAKLEALKDREREKTRKAVEQERARLEAELSKEISMLENQLERNRSLVSEQTPVEIPEIAVPVKSKAPAGKRASSTKVSAARPDTKQIPKVEITKSDTIITPVGEVVLKPGVQNIQETPAVTLATPVTEVEEVVAMEAALVFEVASEEADMVEKPTVTKTTIAKPKPAVKLTPAQKAKEKERLDKIKAKEKEKAKLVKQKAKEKEKEKLAKIRAKEKEKEKIARQKAREKEKLELAKAKKAALAAERQAAKEASLLVKEQEVREEIVVADQEVQDAVILSVEKAQTVQEQTDKEAAEKAAMAAQLAEIQAAKDESAKAAAAQLAEIQAAKEAAEKDAEAQLAEIQAAKEQAAKAAAAREEMIAKAAVIEKQDPRVELDTNQQPIQIIAPAVVKTEISEKGEQTKTVMNSLQKLREKINAQKQLERELMEKEALKTQEKDKTIFEKLADFHIEEEEITPINDDLLYDQLESEKMRVEELVKETEGLVNQISSLERDFDYVMNLRHNGIHVIDKNDLGLSKEFLEYNNSEELNKAIEEIDREFEELRTSYQAKIERLEFLEKDNAALFTLYQNQTITVKNLTEQVAKLNDHIEVLNKQISDLNLLTNELKGQISLERDINKKYQADIDYLNTLREELEGKIIELNSNIQNLDTKLNVKDSENMESLSELEGLRKENEEYQEMIHYLENEVRNISIEVDRKLKTEDSYSGKVKELELQKKNLETKILGLNSGISSKLKNFDTNNLAVILDELENINNKIAELANLKEETKAKDLLKAKEVEIEELRNKYDRDLRPTYNPYHPYQIPLQYLQQYSNNDQILSEIRKLKEEIAELKKPQDGVLVEELRKNLENSREELRGITEGLDSKSNELTSALERELEKTRLELEKKATLESEIKITAEVDKQKLLSEIDNLKQELEASKIPSVDFEKDAKLLEQTKQELDKSRKEIKNLSKQKDAEIAKIEEEYKSKIKEKEEKLDTLSSNKDQRIKELEKAISEKDSSLTRINEELKLLSEDDIFDPKFKRQIRVIREMKDELQKKEVEEANNYKESSKLLQEEINNKGLEVDQINDRIFKVDMDYKEKRDFTSASKEEYEKKRSKLFVELQLQEERLKDLEDDQTRINLKYSTFTESKESQLEKLANDENEIIKDFLNRLRTSKSTPGFKKLKETQAEKDDLVKELNSLKDARTASISGNIEPAIDTSNDAVNQEETSQVENSIPTVSINKNIKIESVENPIVIENELRVLSNNLSDVNRNISDLKEELEKRVRLEANLRANAKTVSDYILNKINLDKCLNEFDEKSNNINDAFKLLEKTSDRSALLKLKSEISDNEIHRNDLQAKIDYYKKLNSDLEKDTTVKNYLTLTNQIERIREAQKLKLSQLEDLRNQIKVKTKYLEQIKASY